MVPVDVFREIQNTKDNLEKELRDRERQIEILSEKIGNLEGDIQRLREFYDMKTKKRVQFVENNLDQNGVCDCAA